MDHATKNIPYLDGWRGLAIVFVLVSHFGFGGHSWTGSFGVLLFFVLSGSLMSQLLFVKQVPLKDFFVRRITRIIPTFWMFTLIMAVLVNFVLKSPFKVSVEELVATLTFLRTYIPATTSIWQTQWPIGHIWSLNIEEHSYIMLAIGAFFCRKSANKWMPASLLLASTTAILLVGLYYQKHSPLGASPWQLRSECGSFGLISAAAIRLVRERRNEWTVPPLLPVLAFGIAVMCFMINTSFGLETTLAPLCLALSLVYLDHAPAMIHRILSAKWLRWFGLCSFSLYIWQQPFFSLAGKYKFNSTLMLLAAIVVGGLSFYFYENPLRIYLNDAWAGRQKKFAELKNPYARRAN